VLGAAEQEVSLPTAFSASPVLFFFQRGEGAVERPGPLSRPQASNAAYGMMRMIYGGKGPPVTVWGMAEDTRGVMRAQTRMVASSLSRSLHPPFTDALDFRPYDEAGAVGIVALGRF